MADSLTPITGIGGILLFIDACRNVYKAFKEKSEETKLNLCMVVIFGGIFLEIIFLYVLNPDFSVEKVVDLFIWGGYFQK